MGRAEAASARRHLDASIGVMREDFLWAACEAHAMIIVWCLPCLYGLPLSEQKAHWLVRRNPLYYLCYYGAAFFILSGKWLHSLWGQESALI